MSTPLLWLLIGALALGGLLAAALTTRGADLADPKQQLRAVRASPFERRPILNREEFERFRWIETWAEGTQYRVFAQVPYGEVLRTPNRDAFRSINSKRADMLIVDAAGLPVVAIEYQGGGHWQGDARYRDAVKRAAIERAGVALVELYPEDDRKAVIAALEEALE